MELKQSSIVVFIACLLAHITFAQTGEIRGIVQVDSQIKEFAKVYLEELPSYSAISQPDGSFVLDNVPYGTYTLTTAYAGYEDQVEVVTLSKENPIVTTDFNLYTNLNLLDQMVVTGTKTYKRQTNSPVIVNVVTAKVLDNIQACNLSEGLRFQPGLRVETDCQTCNYTQLRMNGLAGGYSQILINGRPIFSPLTGLYGLEQIPTNMIERIEVIRGGGSSLYGSSAIGGTVNVITKLPINNTYEVNAFYQNIDGQSDDKVISGNTSLVSANKNAGVSIFINHRERDFYDENDDNFSELPKLENTSIGTSLFFLPSDNQKIELNLSNLNEFRFGGEMVDKPAYLTKQSEERTHNVWMGSADYQINFNDKKSSFIAYGAWQNTDRKHYTGIFPDEPEAIQAHLENPPYGTSTTTTLQGGFQINHKVLDFIQGTNTFTLGSEYVVDDVFDEISTYNYLIDQKTTDFGTFIQSDWDLSPSINLLTGIRLDKHNLIDNVVLSPRTSLLIKYKTNTQFRLSYGTGFRAPQAFDTDLHIAFAGGGVSRISLSPDLEPEKSQSFSASINYDKPTEHFIAGFTLEGFYTRLDEAFYLQPIGEDSFGELFEKQNGQGATVKGLTIETRANFDKIVQVEAGLTIQSSEFDNEVEYIDGLPGLKEFTRTPNTYGFAMITYTPSKKWNANLNYVYTGEMKVPHFAGAPNQNIDEIISSDSFSNLSAKLGYTIPIDKIETNLEVYGGVKNIFNAYQDNFDIGKNRDSNFIYGPSLPRTIFVCLKLKSF